LYGHVRCTRKGKIFPLKSINIFNVEENSRTLELIWTPVLRKNESPTSELSRT